MRRNLLDHFAADFIDDASNALLKNLLALRFLAEHCPEASFAAVVADDVFVETFHLFSFASAIYGQWPHPNTLACDVIPAGSRGQERGRDRELPQVRLIMAS